MFRNKRNNMIVGSVEIDQVIAGLAALDKYSQETFLQQVDFHKFTKPVADALGVGHAYYCIMVYLEEQSNHNKEKNKLKGHVQDIIEALTKFSKRLE